MNATIRGLHSRNALWARLALAALFIVLFTVPGFTQTFVKTLWFDFDQKHYSIETQQNNSSQAEYFMAGTVYNSPYRTDGIQHFVRMDASNNIATSMVYYDNSMHDERVVDIVSVDYNEHYLISLCRQKNTMSGATGPQDVIKIIGVDENGNELSGSWEHVVRADPVSHFVSLYPTHAIHHNGYLYICGYGTGNYSGYSSGVSPKYSDPKSSFIVKVDLANPGGAGTFAKYYETACTTLNTAATEDYDMAMRMKIDPNGNILVTGGCNGGSIDYSAGQLTWLPANYSTTLVLTVSPVNLAVVNGVFKGITTNASYFPLYDPPLARNEFGVDMISVTAYDGNTNDATFILSNTGGGEDLSNGMDYRSYPGPIYLTALDHNNFYNLVNYPFEPLQTTVPPPAPTPSAPDRLRVAWNWEYFWGLQLLPSHQQAPLAADGNVVVTGMQTSHPSCQLSNPWPDQSNINPFIAHYKLGINFTDDNFNISVKSNVTKWMIHQSANGTDGFTSGGSVYGYNDLGGGLAMNYWAPTFATRDNAGATSDIVFTAPVAQSGLFFPGIPRKLNMKIIRADNNGEEPNCDHYGDCPPGDEYYRARDWNWLVSGCAGTPGDFDIFIHQPSCTTVIENPTVRDCTVTGQDDAWKTTGVEDVAKSTISVYPNPANDELNVSGIQKAEYRITDITGRVLSSGTITGLTSINIKALAAGIYIIEIDHNSNNTEKTQFVKQ